jgi:hypothetical protein
MAELKLTEENLKEIRAYLGDVPSRFANPLFNFLAQLEAESNKNESPKEEQAQIKQLKTTKNN